MAGSDDSKTQPAGGGAGSAGDSQRQRPLTLSSIELLQLQCHSGADPPQLPDRRGTWVPADTTSSVADTHR